ncbi:MAG TPA: PspC domain-containing protein [Propionibacterium sp.]|nr:PspC domain-containing protein [Propionibacterium sp.]
MEPLTELRRSTSDRRVAGVCVMLADRWQVDPLLIRVAAVLLALSSGMGIVLYAAAWAVVPPAGSDQAPIDSVLPGVRRLGLKAGIALLIVAMLFFAGLVGHVMPFGFGPALVIGAVWYLGWYRPEQARRAAAPKEPETPQLAARPFAEQTPFTEAASAWQARVQEYLASQAGPAHPAPPTTEHDPGYSLRAFLAHPDPVGLYQPSPAPSAERQADVAPSTGSTPAVPGKSPVKKRRRSWRLQLVGWLLAGMAVTAVAILDRSMGLPLYAYLAALLLAVGLTMMLSAWFTRPRGLVVAGAILGILVGGAAAPLDETPDTTVAYSTIADVPAEEAHGNGEHVVDLSALRLEEDLTYATSVDLGKVTIIVPPDTNMRVVWTVDVGEAHVLDRHVSQGFDLGDTTVAHGTDPDGPTLTIEARVGLGQLEVKR